MVPNCCLVISVIYKDKEFNLNIYPQTSDTGEVVGYYFLVPDGDGELFIGLSYNNGLWIMHGESEEQVFYALKSYDCPYGNMSEWEEYPVNKPPFSDFTIYNTGCGGPTEDVVVEIEIDNTVYNPCKYKNALIKGKRSLAEDIAKLSTYETFGLEGCEDKWSTAIAKYLAIDALKCPPYGVYTETDERCLISKIATNYKC